MLPGAGTGLPARRRGRLLTFVVAVASAACLVIGCLLGRSALLAVIGVFVLCVLAALDATRGRVGALTLALGVPLIGTGFSSTIRRRRWPKRP